MSAEDSGTDAADDSPLVDAGGDADAFPAPLQIVSAGGPVLTSPKIIPIIFDGDTRQAALEQFMSDLVSSNYWSTVTGEYGVGPLTAGTTIVAPASELPTAPIDYVDVDSYITSHLAAGDGGASSWGSFDPNAIYTIFYPQSVVLRDGTLGTSCQDFSGYHSETSASPHAVYAVIAACPMFAEFGITDGVTIAASHEWVESATDPHHATNPAFGFTDPNHAEWMLYTGLAEVGDVCVLDSTAYTALSGTSHVISRTWSNEAAMSGHNPCVPEDTSTYFIARPVFTDTVPIATGYPGWAHTQGIQVKLGDTKTVEVDLMSDGPRSAWDVSAYDSKLFYGGMPELLVTLSPSAGSSGDKLQMTIQRVKTGTVGGGSLLYISSYTSSLTYRYWLAFVAN
jgi:hypothetical protein